MKTPLHFDFLKEEERYSSNPVRLRVMLPLLTSLIFFGTLLWWLLFVLRVHGQVQLKADLEQAISSLTPANKSVLTTRTQEQEYKAVIRQITLFKHSRNLLGTTLRTLATDIPENIQLTELRITQPPQPPADPLHPAGVPTNTCEAVTLRFAGRTGGDHPSDSVNQLMVVLRSEAYTNLIRSAVIPKGAFRQDTLMDQANRGALLFEIMCDCVPRRFE
jgi:Tfp pilus assembly protein PilN